MGSKLASRLTVADIIEHTKANKIRAYIDAVAQGKEHEALASEAAAWTAWAKQKAAWLDPMIKVSDIVLDAPEPERPSYWW